MSYTLDGITLQVKRTPSGIGYYQYGEDHLPTIVFFHGAGEKGDGSAGQLQKVMVAGPFRRTWEMDKGYTGWQYRDAFSQGVRILYPQLPTSMGSWSVAYIDSFLDAVHTNQPLLLAGFSLGGGGALRYAAQVNKKHKLTCFVGIASAISPVTGENVDCPYFITHATNDPTVLISHSDNYVMKIPPAINGEYLRGTGGGHWFYVSQAFTQAQLYDWFKSLIPAIEPPVVTPEDVQGVVIKRGSQVIAKFGEEEVFLNSN
jgi:pimeloyl-ACP methyl ester carboxylesterase